MNNNENFVATVMERTSCKRHGVEEGVACWPMYPVQGPPLSAICNKRAKRAGFDGKIDDKSLRTNRPHSINTKR